MPVWRLVFMGTPEFATVPLEYLFASGHQIVSVYTQPDKTAGRGRLLAESPVKKGAVELGLPVVQPSTFKPAEVVGELADLKPDVVVVAAFGQILPQSVLS